mmetsp:Transcript_59891/g.97009  ORF Transcript_59891/g.97009 Transcript_59891/m.97009 type:complete len:658 (+) Transcript_59891:514-2487(+)
MQSLGVSKDSITEEVQELADQIAADRALFKNQLQVIRTCDDDFMYLDCIHTAMCQIAGNNNVDFEASVKKLNADAQSARNRAVMEVAARLGAPSEERAAEERRFAHAHAVFELVEHLGMMHAAMAAAAAAGQTFKKYVEGGARPSPEASAEMTSKVQVNIEVAYGLKKAEYLDRYRELTQHTNQPASRGITKYFGKLSQQLSGGADVKYPFLDDEATKAFLELLNLLSPGRTMQIQEQVRCTETVALLITLREKAKLVEKENPLFAAFVEANCPDAPKEGNEGGREELVAAVYAAAGVTPAQVQEAKLRWELMISDMSSRTEELLNCANTRLYIVLNTPLSGAEPAVEDLLPLVAASFSVDAQPELVYKDIEEAIQEKDIVTAMKMIESGGGVNIAKTRTSAKPLYLAAKLGLTEWMQQLLSAGAAVDDVHDNMNETALQVAIHKGHLEIVRLLLAAGADKDLPGGSGKLTPLLRAMEQEQFECVKLLAEAGANLTGSLDRIYNTPRPKDNLRELADFLIAKDATATVSRPADWSPLVTAAKTGNVEKLTALLAEEGAVVDAESGDKSTLLFLAAEAGYVKAVELLLSKGANKDAANDRTRTPLHRAAYNGHKDCVDVLLKAGAAWDTTDRGGDTPLGDAKRKGHDDVLKLLEALAV